MRTVLLATLSLSCFVATAHAETAGGLTWKSPTTWKADAARPMRVATYHVAAARGDTDEAELAIFYFGQGQGGSVDDNLKRWAGEFEPPKPPVTKKEKLAGVAVTRIEVKGTYGGGMAATLASGGGAAPAKKDNYELLGAIVEAPQGSVFFKLTGPQKTVESARVAFDKMMKSITK